MGIGQLLRTFAISLKNFLLGGNLVFIDGTHSYDYVRNDTMKALYCCHSGSVIAWHDFGRRGVNEVRKWILELSKKYEIYAIPGGTLAFMVVP